MTRAITGTRAQAERIQALDAKAAGLPRKGRHVGGGIHASMTDDPTSPGWTRHVHSVRKHPDRDEWAYPMVTLDTIDLMTLTDSEHAEVAKAKTDAWELPADWTPPTAIP